MRASQSAPILRRIHAALERIRNRSLPQSAFGKAITYTLDLWPALEHFVTDGRIEIDNNGVENAIRPTVLAHRPTPLVPSASSALGKRNWRFIGAAHSGERGAIFYTIVESCRRRGIDPQAYLRAVLTRRRWPPAKSPRSPRKPGTKARGKGTHRKPLHKFRSRLATQSTPPGTR